MICPFCQSEKSAVLKTVSLMQNSRVRLCSHCKRSYTTAESVDPEIFKFAKALEHLECKNDQTHA